MGQSYRPILCSFQLTAVSILTMRYFPLRNVYLSFFPLFTFCDRMKLIFDKRIKNARSALLSYISTREFLRTREK